MTSDEFSNIEQLDENLHKWFKEKWVRFGPDGKIRGACARGDDSEGKPKCLPQKKAQNLGKKGRKYAASKKRREDPNPERRGKAKNVATKKKTNEGVPFDECPKCRGPIVHESMMNEKQDACYHKVKSRYKVWPSAYASGALVQCRKKGASNWGTGGKKNESNVMKGIVDEAGSPAQQAAIAINMKKKGQKPKNVTESLLTEGKVLLEGRVVRKLWESAGHKIVEAQLTPQQIQQIFQAAEQGQTTAGGNRTIAGKGVDAASAVNRAWEDLKTKIQNTGPIQNMDAMYDKAAEAMKKSTGGDQGAMAYVQKYRDFAKKHPIAQSFLYAALIAAAGLSGAGAGGAAALGLLKMTDRLLQGDKFSSALYKGGVTGGLAYGATKIGDLLRPEQAGFKGGGGDFGGGGADGSWEYDPTSPTDKPKPIFVGNESIVIHSPGGGDLTVRAGDTLSEIAQRNNVSVQELLDANKDILNPDRLAVGQNVKIPSASGLGPYDQGVGTASDTYAKMQTGQYAQDPISYRQAAKAGLQGAGDQVTSVPGAKSVARAAADQAVNAPSAATDAPASAVGQAPSVKPAADAAVSTATDNIAQNDILNSVNKDIRGKVVDMDFETGSWAKLANGKIVDPDFPMDAGANNDAMAAYKLLNKTNEGIQLSKYQVFNILEAAIMYQTVLNEGLLDKFKGAAGKAAQWAKTKGHNVTTKITADKLMQAWKKAGSPTDSEKVKAVLKAAGVSDQVIAAVMPAQAPVAGAAPNATTGTVQSTMKATTQPTVPAKPQAPAAPAQAAQPASAIGQGIAKSPQANVNPELYNRLAARKAGKPVYAGGLEETKAKPYVKPFIENGKQVGWKSSDGYHVKYWQMFAKDSAIKHAKISPDEVQEDYTGEFAAEKTPAINPYGGLKDNQFRGAISETPTDNPTGASGEGGWRKYKPKPAGQLDEEYLDEGLMQKIGAAAMAAALALGSTAVKAEPVYVYKAPTGDFKAVLSPTDIPANAMRRLVVDTENDDVAILGKDGSETPIKLDPSTVNNIKQQAGIGQTKSTQPQAPAQQSAAPKVYREKFGTGGVFKGKNIEKYGLTNTFNDPFSPGQDQETLLKNIKKIHDNRPAEIGEKIGSIEFIDSDNNKADKIARINYTNGRLDIYLLKGGAIGGYITARVSTGNKIKYIMLWADWTIGKPQEKKPIDFEEDTAYAGGMGQGGNAGESYRKFKPKSAGTFKEDELDEACWKGYHKEGNKKMFGKTYPNCVKNTNEEEQLDEKCWDSHKQVGMKNKGGRQVPNCVPKESAIMKGLKSL